MLLCSCAFLLIPETALSTEEKIWDLTQQM